MSKPRLRNFVATINNWDAEKLNAVKSIEYKYCVIGFEGKDTTPHLQVYIELSKRVTFKKIKDLLPTAHIEPRKGTAKQAAEYCKKEGDFFEDGEISQHGKRTDLQAVLDDIKDNPTIKNVDLIENHTGVYARYPKFVALCKRTYNKQPTLDWKEPPNIWCYGAAGTGKTSMYMNEQTYQKLINKWWDDYDGEDDVLLDDVDPESMKYLAGHLKRWADRYPFRAETKGGTLCLRPKRIIVTSNYSIEDCFPNPQDVAAMRRRFKVIHKVSL